MCQLHSCAEPVLDAFLVYFASGMTDSAVGGWRARDGPGLRARALHTARSRNRTNRPGLTCPRTRESQDEAAKLLLAKSRALLDADRLKSISVRGGSAVLCTSVWACALREFSFLLALVALLAPITLIQSLARSHTAARSRATRLDSALAPRPGAQAPRSGRGAQAGASKVSGKRGGE